MKTLVVMVFAILSPLALSQGQDEYEPRYLHPDPIFGSEAKQLLNDFGASPQVAIRFENQDRSPLTIVGASITSVKRRQPGESKGRSKAEDEYAVDARVTLVNNTDRRIIGVTLTFNDVALRTEFDLSDQVAVEPYGKTTFGEPQNEAPEFISLPMRPQHPSVKVLEVRFEDGAVWGVHSPDVDEEPVPLTRPRWRHTEEAIINKIQGSLRMRLLVSSEGLVKKVEIVRGLPEGLNEQAMKQAFKLKFKPAINAGQPVECWLLFEVTYHLRLFRRITPNRMSSS